MRRNYCMLMMMGLAMAAPLHAAYAPELTDSTATQKAEAKKGINALKGMNKAMREACIAERLGLIFTPSGRPAYSAALTNTTGEDMGSTYHNINSEASYVGSDGKLHNYNEAIGKHTKKKGTPAPLIKLRKAYETAGGEEIIFAAYAKETTDICLQTAKYSLAQLPDELRDAVLAELAGLIFQADENAPDKDTTQVSIAGTTHTMEVRAADDKARYIDSKGTRQKYASILRKAQSNQVQWRARILTLWCAQLIGAEEVLALYPTELETMKKHHEDRDFNPFD